MKTSFSLVRSRQKLYRRITACATVGALLFLVVAGINAQTKKRKGPRAIAVVRWDADAKNTAVPVLVPVAILDEGKFYDASVYKAAPAPMPLLVGTVYEAQDEGETLGYFTIKNQARTPQKESWVALGDWQNAIPPANKVTDERKSSVEVVHGKMTENTGANAGDDNDDRDLRKQKTTVYDENGKPMPEGTQASPAAPMGGAGGTKPKIKTGGDTQSDSSKSSGGTVDKKSTDDPDRPTMKRPGSSDSQSKPDTTSQTSSQTQASQTKPDVTAGQQSKSDSADTSAAATQDPDRPQLKRGKPATKTSAGGLPHTVNSDPDVPVIRRNSGKDTAAKKPQGIPVPLRVLDRGPLLGEGDGDQPTLKRTRTYETVAVSDATVDAPQNFHYKMSSDERESLQSQMDALAQTEVDKYLKSVGRAREGMTASVPKGKTAAGKKGTAVRKSASAKTAKDAEPPKSQFAETQFEVLDLNHRNDPVLVFSGRERTLAASAAADAIPKPAEDVYVVYVARIDYQGNAHGIFRSVTVGDRLDVTPKLELIDAIDANGDGNGELLFRRVSADGAEFAIYKASFDGLTEIFHGGTAD